ncbi:enoyl-CoA hydratase-related protein [Oceanicoccus sagamiensis]|uniref:Enoyl-CoA hydratase n=1 Tax=Oceanicoccus sagamiensis TaxID=716816 RepID=A0A1X9NC34_9GAMM|nr:enoyl-CoA hydratase-related protein [Oceanicoccus sagamiensis]ARN73099.1 enoyl-CoA hydratase [Oceanicoccus sagamiensis]
MKSSHSSPVLVEERGNILLVTINRPDSMNALTPQTNTQLAQVFRDFEANPELRVAILTGAGSKAFCSGNDLKFTATATPEQRKQPAEGFAGLTSFYDRKKPVIAAVNGFAFGGGFEIALATDIVVAAAHAQFALPEPKVGLAALAGGMHRLPRQVPLKQAVAAMITGDPISAERGEQMGFVNKVVPQEQLLEAAIDYANKIIACAPLSVEVTLATVNETLKYDSVEQAMSLDSATRERILGSEDFKEGIQAFVEKRKPNWQGQ